jgi:hypothetical protein
MVAHLSSNTLTFFYVISNNTKMKKEKEKSDAKKSQENVLFLPLEQEQS